MYLSVITTSITFAVSQLTLGMHLLLDLHVLFIISLPVKYIQFKSRSYVHLVEQFCGLRSGCDIQPTFRDIGLT